MAIDITRTEDEPEKKKPEIDMDAARKNEETLKKAREKREWKKMKLSELK